MDTENNRCMPSLVRVLLVEDNPGDARLFHEILVEAVTVQFELKHVPRLSEALKRLGEESFDVILLDLSLPDSHGLDTLVRVHSEVPNIPIVVLTGLDDETIGLQAVKNGAQDYLVKGRVDTNLLVRSICYAMERQRLQSRLQKLSLLDELTGLYNRRGFLTLAEQQLKLADRTNRGFLLIYADLDGLKQINDTFGHKEGDKALIETANILKQVFRSSDIIARIGGDEFAIVVVESTKDDIETISTRLREKFEEHKSKNPHYDLSISIGIVRYDSGSPCSIDRLMNQADSLMYEQKMDKKKRGIIKDYKVVVGG